MGLHTQAPPFRLRFANTDAALRLRKPSPAAPRRSWMQSRSLGAGAHGRRFPLPPAGAVLSLLWFFRDKASPFRA